MRYLERNRIADFEAAASTLVELEPDRAAGHLMLGVAWARQKKFESAEAALRRSIEIDPENTNAWTNLVQLLRVQGRTAEAAGAERRLQGLRGDSIP
jgi:cytochrome c-type biogenesis protein CcmH/NrfG